MNNIDNVIINEKYSKEEIEALSSFIETIKNDETRSELACWGNYSDYNKGY
ncbi:hypothetical protein R4Q14_01320 [Brachyspira intermedia]|uniref:hypothetical protein n=1 Tax=Brachyspira intermedia TaxID=84377 RepID=UPI00300579BF